MELGSLLEVLLMVGGFIVTGFASVKIIFKKVMRAVDEIEDVVTASAETLKEGVDVLNSIVNAGKPEADGSIKFTSAEWAIVRREVVEVKAAALKVPKELKEAVISVKAIFKKGA